MKCGRAGKHLVAGRVNPERKKKACAAVERTRRKPDSQGQIMALDFRFKSLKHFKVFSPRSEAVVEDGPGCAS